MGSLSLVAAGDLVPSRRLFGAGGRPASPAFGAAAAPLQRADIAFGNLEMPLSTAGAPLQKPIAFRASPAIVPDLRMLGLDVISLANNHILDYGQRALERTRRGLEAQGIATFGAGAGRDAAEEPVVLVRDGLRVGFTGWTCLLPAGTAAGEGRPGLATLHVRTAIEVDPYLQLEAPGAPPRVRTWADEADLARALARVRALREAVDLLVVSIHWGYGPGDELAEYQRPLGHALVDAGADLVLGHHVHAVQGVEVHRGRAIVYSLGGFISQQPRRGASAFAIQVFDRMSPDACLALVDVAEDATYRLRLRPVSTNRDGLPELAGGAVQERIAARMTDFSRRLGLALVPGEDGALDAGTGLGTGRRQAAAMVTAD